LNGLKAIQAPDIQAVIWPAQYQDFSMKQYLENLLNEEDAHTSNARHTIEMLFNKNTSYRFFSVSH
tara:strand:+ start:744 stop:941 length:198 start_codon:yes stop_codon:yes gene_type:complete